MHTYSRSIFFLCCCYFSFYTTMFQTIYYMTHFLYPVYNIHTYSSSVYIYTCTCNIVRCPLLFNALCSMPSYTTCTLYMYDCPLFSPRRLAPCIPWIFNVGADSIRLCTFYSTGVAPLLCCILGVVQKTAFSKSTVVVVQCVDANLLFFPDARFVRAT